MDWILFAPNDVARLPTLAWQQGWLSAGWSVVVAVLGAWAVNRVTSRQVAKVAVATALAAWVWLPGSWGGAYWLGLAFQAPSLLTVLWCALLWLRTFLRPNSRSNVRSIWPRHVFFLGVCAVALGWILLLDTLGVWPGSFYNWGFGAAAPAIVLAIASLPWIMAKKALPTNGVALIAMATLLFVALRLPTGNLFDALLDPGSWCYLQFAMFQQWRNRVKSASI